MIRVCEIFSSGMNAEHCKMGIPHFDELQFYCPSAIRFTHAHSTNEKSFSGHQSLHWQRAPKKKILTKKDMSPCDLIPFWKFR